MTSCQQISELLQGANALLVVYDPTSEVENTLHSLAQSVQVQSKYFPLSVASIASKNHSKKFDRLVCILNPCCHTTLSFEEPSIDKHCKVSRLCFLISSLGHSFLNYLIHLEYRFSLSNFSQLWSKRGK